MRWVALGSREWASPGWRAGKDPALCLLGKQRTASYCNSRERERENKKPFCFSLSSHNVQHARAQFSGGSVALWAVSPAVGSAGSSSELLPLCVLFSVIFLQVRPTSSSVHCTSWRTKEFLFKASEHRLMWFPPIGFPSPLIHIHSEYYTWENTFQKTGQPKTSHKESKQFRVWVKGLSPVGRVYFHLWFVVQPWTNNCCGVPEWATHWRQGKGRSVVECKRRWLRLHTCLTVCMASVCVQSHSRLSLLEVCQSAKIVKGLRANAFLSLWILSPGHTPVKPDSAKKLKVD